MSNSISGAHALVFGASGLQGWSVVNQLLSSYPAVGKFSRITALTNRLLPLSKCFWPEPSPTRPHLDLVSGINVNAGNHEELSSLLKTKIGSIESVTHVFFFVHQASPEGLVREAEINVQMLDRSIRAVSSLAPRLQFVVYPGGAMAYGVYAPGGAFKPPLTEDVPRLPSPGLGDTIPYYGFRDTLTKLSSDQDWTWAEITMDAIIGFAPNGSGWSLAGHWATWLSVYRLVEGEGAEVPFPGTETAYDALFNECSAEMVAKEAIWVSLHPEKTSGQIFNVADRMTPTTWRERWPVIASSFGLVGVGPRSDAGQELKPSEYIRKHGHLLREEGFEADLVHLPGHLDGVGFHLDFDRQFSLEKVRRAGFAEEKDPNETWTGTFAMFRKAGLIP